MLKGQCSRTFNRLCLFDQLSRNLRVAGEWHDEQRGFFGKRKSEIIANIKTTNIVTIILELQNEEREFGKV